MPDDLVHHEDPAGGERRVHGRHRDADVVGAVRLQPHADARLVLVVQLLFDTGDQLVGEGRQAHRARRLDASLELPGRQAEDCGIAGDHLVDARSLDLDHDPLAGGEDGAVGLTDGCRGERLPLERRERLLHRLAELVLDHPAHVVGVDGRDVGPQVRELARDDLGEDVGARRRDLPELHEHPARLLEHTSETPGELR
jgi:hypothetical protein